MSTQILGQLVSSIETLDIDMVMTLSKHAMDRGLVREADNTKA